MRRAFFLHRDVEVLYRVVPFVTSAFAVILSVVPVHVPGLAIATPAFALMAIYHWSIYRPDLLPPSGVFAIGLALDLLNGTPYLGVSSLMLLLARSLVLAGRRFVVNKPFAIVWAGFLGVAAIIIGFEWLLTSVLSAVSLGSRPFAYQAVVTSAIFPVGSYLLAQSQRAFLRRV
jgi:rod shape-determining protein MreD